MKENHKGQPPVIQVKDLSVTFRRYDKGMRQRSLTVISHLDIEAGPGEIVAIAGSSGSGKSLFAHAVMGLLPENASMEGVINYKGIQITRKDQERLRGKKIAFIPQSISYLDPLMQIGSQVRGAKPDKSRIAGQKEVWKRFQLEEKAEGYYPFQLSGGMARRVLVATAVISGAELIIADEPTPGLDLKMALEALQCFRELAEEGKAVILITHDIDLAFHIADRVAVFYAGTTVEMAAAEDFRKGPEALRHPYSKALWNALPQNGFVPIPGFQPYAGNLPDGCLFLERCPCQTEECRGPIPMKQVRGGSVRCIHAT